MNVTPEEISGILALLNTAATAASHSIDAYQQAKTLAAQSGISKADLDAADARFQKNYPDPLAK